MNNQSFLLNRYIFCIILGVPILFFAMGNNRFGRLDFIFAETNELNQNNDINSSFDNSNDSYLPTNPIGLMNVLREIDSMADRTPPSDAIDDALRAFENKEEEGKSF